MDKTKNMAMAFRPNRAVLPINRTFERERVTDLNIEIRLVLAPVIGLYKTN
ncbi:MAG TPA: hypothetical protein VGR78_10370 [Verrucomicrobiae bacterium]|nr:hypothetical protein [Verrucomicrobiae bacterium]